MQRLMSPLILALFLGACGSPAPPVEETSPSTPEPTVTEEPETVPADTSGCDPRVAEYTKLLQDYFADLERMEQQQHYDAPLQEAWAVNAIRLRSALNAVGPAGLGESCWMEYEAAQERYHPLIADKVKALAAMKARQITQGEGS
ncbi:MAG TPA: hypothetical protein P5027_12110 [Flavobacteriales bacterium]|nr:hypothetical protein [Flavobacteriales bacterium]HRW90686.1 hypothetical protein [Flavobacteriales bacterium]